MTFFQKTKFYSFNKFTYINLRWIGIIGQFITVNIVYFILNFEFEFIKSNLIILLGSLSNLYLIYIYKKTQLTEKVSLIFLIIDIAQLGSLIYLTGGITNPFILFIIIPSVFSSSFLTLQTNLILMFITISIIIFLTFFSKDLPFPLSKHFHVSEYYLYAIPTSLIIALIFLNYFAIMFGTESRLRKEALDKMEKIMAQEHELVSLGGQAAAAAHSLSTPLSTINIITHELLSQFRDQKEIFKDIELLSSQVERCNQILKRLSLNPAVEDDFIDRDINLKEYIQEITKSFEEISKKKFIINYEKFTNEIFFKKSVEIVYGLRNFIGNANKFAKNNIEIILLSNKDYSEVIIKDDGEGFPKDVLTKIGEPYLKTYQSTNKLKSGLGLGIFIGKTLLEKNFAKVICNNSKNEKGAEIKITWKNKDLLNI